MSWTYRTDEVAGILGAQPPAVAAQCAGVSTDSRKIKPGDLFFALSGPNFNGNLFVADALEKGAAAAVTSVAGCGARILVTDPLVALQRFAAHHRGLFNVPVLAITGSCGKTSTKDLTAAVLASKYNVVKTIGNLNNDIGCPLSLLHMDDATRFAVIEMGANHSGEIRALCNLARPTEAAITLIAPAHLEGFGSVANIARAKAEIVQNLPESGAFYVNSDDQWCVQIADEFQGDKVYFGSRGDVELKSAELIAPGRLRVDIKPLGEMTLPLSCRAHATNVMLAVAVGLRHGVEDFESALAEACTAAARFKTLQVGCLLVIDDSYNANPASVKASLQALAEWPTAGRRYAALGEMLELGEAAPQLHFETGIRAGELGIDYVYAVGPHAPEVVAGAISMGVAAEEVSDPVAIADILAGGVRGGDILLVKGSRGMRMERVIDALRARFS